MTYSARMALVGRWWMVAVPEIDGLTQARRLRDAELVARELIAVTLDLPRESLAIALVMEPIGEIDVEDRLATIRRARAEPEARGTKARSEMAAFAGQLAGQNIPVRDIAWMLGVSSWRARKLIHDDGKI
jgi:hypothetical protein